MARTFETPKGTRDFLPEEMRIRNAVFERLRRAFRLFGYDELDTPAFEYLEVLTLKSGPAAEREIYSFEDKGSRKLGLRFDLTSSTGRFAASHPELKRPIYRYQIGKVWRYDRPAAGRYREFYQADADILGSYSMDCEVDLLLLATTVLKEFGLHDYRFVLNHRKILEAQLRRAGIPVDKKADALRALDKFDKIGRTAMIDEAKGYGLDEPEFVAFIEQLGITADATTQLDNLAYLRRTEALLTDDPEGKKATTELLYIVERATELGFAERLTVDPTLARGLDYYTGPIFEAKAHVEKFGTTLSFAGGGRYDDLIGLYGGQPQGAVGFSFGVERLIDLLKEQVSGQLETVRPVLIAPLGPGRIADAERVAMLLRQAGVPARLSLGSTAPGKHLQYAESAHIDFVIFVGEDEVKQGRYPVKQLSTRSEQRLTLDELAQHLRSSGVAIL
ncbi:MAG: histidine--tRNA ligase [Deltaproteobacteria bacterium]|jgi:histidyl-tRNA synthetase|nr:histidine--tRNA ligase [Deltaproteobacteria bacterium]